MGIWLAAAFVSFAMGLINIPGVEHGNAMSIVAITFCWVMFVVELVLAFVTSRDRHR